VWLFVDRARAVLPSFRLDETNRAAIYEICRRLDGIPLAIELAAARLPLLGVEGLRARLNDRFNLLTGGARVVLRRHQTLRATLEWSHGLLTPDEQTVFRRLGVFAGGFTLEAAQHVASDERLDPWTALDHLGLSETLRETVSAWRERHPGVACDLRLQGALEGMGETINITVYRIVQECLTNVARHAAATRSEIDVARCNDPQCGDVVKVVVRDNGKGFAQQVEREATRFGLIGMRERVQALDGEFRIDSSPGEGVTVTAVIPVSAQAFGSHGAEAA
jgi:signal transduction histidine kinase